MRLLFLSTACLGVACGGQATNDGGGESEGDSANVSPAMLTPPPAEDVLDEDVELAAEDVDIAPEDQAPDSTERPSDSDPIADPPPDSMAPVEPLRETVYGCFKEATLGSCEDVAQIELRDISWTLSDGAIVVNGTAVGEDSYYPCFGISPAHAADDQALGAESESDLQAATLQLYAVSDDFPTPVSMSLTPTGSAGNYEIVVWASRLDGECAQPLEILDVTWP